MEELERAIKETRKPSELTPQERELAAFRITRAKTRLVTWHPFFGFLVTSLITNTVWVGDDNQMGDGRELKTLATDGRNLYCYAPFIINIESNEILTGLLLHELFHVLLNHPERAKGFHPYLANVAMDFAVNLWVNDTARALAGEDTRQPLTPQSYKRMPWYIPIDFGFYDEKYRRSDGSPMTWEEIYHLLLQQQPPETFQTIVAMGNPSPGDNGTASGLAGVGEDQQLIDSHEVWSTKPSDSEGSRDDRPLTDRDIAKALSQARAFQQETSGGWGKLPGALRRLVEERISPPLPWTRLLQNYLSYSPGDYAWAPGDVRFGEPFPWPAEEVTLEDIVMVIDTSGSMTDDDVAAAVTQCQHIVKPYRNIRVWLMMADADVQAFVPITQTLPKLERKGYGGTSFIPPFQFLKRLTTLPPAKRVEYGIGTTFRPRVVIYFTDGYGEFPNPDNPEHGVTSDVLWVMTSDVKPPDHRRFVTTRLDVTKR